MINELNELQKLGYVRAYAHKDLPLVGWNYTPIVQYEKTWGEYPLLRLCRGLVTDTDGNIVAYPLKKFFNWEEHEASELPGHGDKIEITEKMDGSLIIVCKYKDSVVYNTRGSFYSDQCLDAQKLFKSLYDESWIEDGKTYLFEYVSPLNRIVVSYDESKLVHIALIDTLTGKDLERDSRFECVPVYTINDGLFSNELVSLFEALDMDNKEGFVVRQVIDEPRQNFRVKWKTEDYRKLHRILTGVSNITVWESLRDNVDLEYILEVCPDEFNDWLRATVNNLKESYNKLELRAKTACSAVMTLPTRKEQALMLLSDFKDVADIAFAMLDNKDYNDAIYKKIRPSSRFQPFEDRENS